MPSRTQIRYPNQRSAGQIQHLNHGTTGLKGEGTQLSEEHVQVPRNKKSFSRASTESESPRGSADIAQVTKISIDLDH